jgi:hypothetical protein
LISNINSLRIRAVKHCLVMTGTKNTDQHKIHTTKRAEHTVGHRTAAMHKIGRIDIL